MIVALHVRSNSIKFVVILPISFYYEKNYSLFFAYVTLEIVLRRDKANMTGKFIEVEKLQCKARKYEFLQVTNVVIEYIHYIVNRKSMRRPIMSLYRGSWLPHLGAL